MEIIRKEATIQNTGADDDFPGSFQVVLSTPAKDRDGDELAIEDWKTPLPEHITFDTDHGMSVATTVGSGAPSIKDGKLIVEGTYSSLPRAQDVRTLVREKHIRTTSVAFSSTKSTKDGKTRTQRELLNGAFVAIPANTEAVVLSAKAGARNSKSDAANLQTIHDSSVAMGADCDGPEDSSGAAEGATGGKSYGYVPGRGYIGLKAKYTADELRQMLKDGEALPNADGDPSYPIGDKADLANAIRAVGRGGLSDHDKIRAYIIRRAKALDASDEIPDNWSADGSVKPAEKALRRMIAAKAVDGSYEQREQAISDALQSAYPGDSIWAYSIATFDDTVVYRVSGSGSSAISGQWQATYTYDAGTVTLGEPERVSLVEQVVPVKSYKATKAPAIGTDTAQLAQSVDAALDEGWNLIHGLDQDSLPEPLQQALGLFGAAWTSAGKLLEAMSVDDPDAGMNPSAEKSADAEALAMQEAAVSIKLLAAAAG